MTHNQSPKRRIIIITLTVLGLVGLTIATAPAVKGWLMVAAVESSHVDHEQKSASLVPGAADTLRLPSAMVDKLGIRTEAVQKAPPPEPLVLSGTLFLDPTRLARVHTRFGGEVVSLGTSHEKAETPARVANPSERPIRLGDKVAKGQLLAVVWSKDLGEKKSELVDAVSKLRLDQDTLQRLEELFLKGSTNERGVREAERNVEADRIAVERARRTLRSWRLTEAEIEAIEAEAARIRQRVQQGPGGNFDQSQRDWARVEVRSPFDGVVVEINAALGDIVDTTLDLFKVADFSKLRVLTHAYEEDLPVLQRLPQQQRRWSIRLKSDPALKFPVGGFDQIGNMIDPNQHTALVMGWVDNADGRLRVGQFITATIVRPPSESEVAIPSSAIVDQGGVSYVFTQPNPAEPQFVRRLVAPSRRTAKEVCLHTQMSEQEVRQGIQPLQVGERVVVVSGLEIAVAMADLLTQTSSHR